jgi:hypothetical protein
MAYAAGVQRLPASLTVRLLCYTLINNNERLEMLVASLQAVGLMLIISGLPTLAILGLGYLLYKDV